MKKNRGKREKNFELIRIILLIAVVLMFLINMGLFFYTYSFWLTGFSVKETILNAYHISPLPSKIFLLAQNGVLLAFAFFLIKSKKSQAAMEFLMTYGWAILAAIIALGVLGYFGVFNSMRPSAAVVSAPFYVDAWNVDSNDKVNLELKNNGGQSYNVIDVKISGEDCGTSSFTSGSMSIDPGSTGVATISCSNDLTTGNPFKGDIAVTYTKSGSNLGQTSSGTIADSVVEGLATGGCTAEEGSDFAGGDGSSGSPYEICDCEMLQLVGSHLDENFILTCDINCDIPPYNFEEGFNPIGASGTPFTKTFDGNGKIISGLTINRPGESDVGLFGSLSGSVNKIGLSDLDFTGFMNIGGITGYLDGGSISETYTTGSIKADYYEVGGLVGYMESGTVTNTYSQVDIEKYVEESSLYYAGGLVGYHGAGSITNSYSIGDIDGVGYLGGISGIIEISAYIDSVFWNGFMTWESFSGGVGGYNTGSVNNAYYNDHDNNPDQCCPDDSCSCTQISDDETYFFDYNNEPMNSWDFTTIWGGSGSSYPCLLWQTDCS